jgi:hypothetical protein
VRTVSAKALGAMVKGMGENSVGEDLLPWLMQTLTSESSPVDRYVYLYSQNISIIDVLFIFNLLFLALLKIPRSGAAQGLAEVVAGLGIEKLHQTMPEIIRTAERTDIAPHVITTFVEQLHKFFII